MTTEVDEKIVKERLGRLLDADESHDVTLTDLSNKQVFIMMAALQDKAELFARNGHVDEAKRIVAIQKNIADEAPAVQNELTEIADEVELVDHRADTRLGRLLSQVVTWWNRTPLGERAWTGALVIYLFQVVVIVTHLTFDHAVFWMTDPPTDHVNTVVVTVLGVIILTTVAYSVGARNGAREVMDELDTETRGG